MKASERKDFQPSRPIGQSLCPVPLLRNKLHIPPVHPISLPRPRLIARLHECREFKLMLISAPAGFGKTTLLSEWTRHCSFPVLWVSLNENDNDPVHFWAYIIDALLSLSKHTDEKVLELLSLDLTELMLAEITNIVSSIPQEFVLILDDYHTIQNPQIHNALTVLLEYLPVHMHIGIASRTRPPLPLARLRACRQFYELHPADLLFTVEEIETFLSCMLGRELPPGQALTIKTRTEGWIAIVHLVAIWLLEQKDGWQALERIPGNHRYILEYLVEEILQQQPQEIQSFLLQTSILAQFNSNLCNAVIGQYDAHLLLEQIERANLFLVPLDHQQNWYSYHQLFRTFLCERLEQVSPNLVSLLHSRACAWYEQQEMYAEAITHALAMRDFERTSEIILKVAEKMLMRGEANTLSGWLEALPEEFIRLYPLLCLFYAWSLMMVGRFEEAEMWVNNTNYVDKKATAIPDMHRQSLAPYTASIIVILRAHIAIFWGEISHIANFTLQAREGFPQTNVFIQCLDMLNIGITKWLGKDIIAAEEAFTVASASGRCLGNNYIILAADCGLTFTRMMRGKRRQAFAIAQQALQLASKDKSYLSPFSIYLYTEMSYLLYEWNRLDEAAHYAYEVLTYSGKQNHDIMMYGYVILSRVKQAQGDLNEAQKLLQLAEDCIPHSQRRPWILSRFAEQYVHLALACHDISCAERWSQIPELDQFGSLAEMLRVQVFLAQNNPRDALRLILMNRGNVPPKELEDKDLVPIVLRAIVYQELKETSLALQALDKALRRAEPEGYIRSFLNEGSKLVPMLHCQLKRYEEQAGSAEANSSWRKLTQYAQLLLDEFAKVEGRRSTGHLSPQRRKDELSERERDILRGMVAGLSNQEISQRMVVAENTVKWHIKNIYSKLQVHNRAQAILEAQKLQIL